MGIAFELRNVLVTDNETFWTMKKKIGPIISFIILYSSFINLKIE